MKKFNISNSHRIYFYSQKVPKNAWHGEDAQGLWICVDHKKIETETPWISLMRYDAALDTWVHTFENGETAVLIHKIADKRNLWNTPVEWVHPRQIAIKKEA